MNKTKFINKLSLLSGYDIEQCSIVNDSLENHLIHSFKLIEILIKNYLG